MVLGLNNQLGCRFFLLPSAHLGRAVLRCLRDLLTIGPTGKPSLRRSGVGSSDALTSHCGLARLRPRWLRLKGAASLPPPLPLFLGAFSNVQNEGIFYNEGKHFSIFLLDSVVNVVLFLLCVWGCVCMAELSEVCVWLN